MTIQVKDFGAIWKSLFGFPSREQMMYSMSEASMQWHGSSSTSRIVGEEDALKTTERRKTLVPLAWPFGTASFEVNISGTCLKSLRQGSTKWPLPVLPDVETAEYPQFSKM